MEKIKVITWDDYSEDINKSINKWIDEEQPEKIISVNGSCITSSISKYHDKHRSAVYILYIPKSLNVSLDLLNS